MIKSQYVFLVSEESWPFQPPCIGPAIRIIRASFSRERMQYLADEGTVIYSGKDGKDRKVFDAPEWLAAMCSHIPNRGEQMVRYYGWYSNVARGKREKLGDDAVYGDQNYSWDAYITT